MVNIIICDDNFKDRNIIDFIKKNNLKYVVSDSKKMDGMIKNNQGIIVDIDNYKYIYSCF